MKNKNFLMSIFLIFIVFIILFTYYKNDKNYNNFKEDNNMYIKKSEFSQETDQILKIFNDEVYFFDYKIDDRIKSFKVDFLKYENNEWVSFASSTKNLKSEDDLKGRIGLKVDKNKLTIIDMDLNEKEYSSSQYEDEEGQQVPDFEDKNLKSVTKGSSSEGKIEINKEIVLFEQYGYIDEKEVYSTGGNFREKDCDKGMVATVTFLDE